MNFASWPKDNDPDCFALLLPKQWSRNDISRTPRGNNKERGLFAPSPESALSEDYRFGD